MAYFTRFEIGSLPHGRPCKSQAIGTTARLSSPWRAQAGIDQTAQAAAGRSNREGRWSVGVVTVFTPTEALPPRFGPGAATTDMISRKICSAGSGR